MVLYFILFEICTFYYTIIYKKRKNQLKRWAVSVSVNTKRKIFNASYLQRKDAVRCIVKP